VYRTESGGGTIAPAIQDPIERATIVDGSWPATVGVDADATRHVDADSEPGLEAIDPFETQAGGDPSGGNAAGPTDGDRYATIDPFSTKVGGDGGAGWPPDPGTEVESFGNYELLGEIARGGMGVVYRARQVSLNRVVALKMILSAQFASREMVERFRVEAEAVAGLDHPNIVPIYEVGEHDNRHYFAMKLIEGGSLASRTADRPIAPREAAEIVATIARAVHHAHRRGILHRDLKPANILLDTDDRPPITDFGLAKRTEGDSGLTLTGAVMGTPSYMPPEQASGKSKALTIAADVYSLGAILYDLMTGRPPFQADSAAETLLQVLHEEPRRPRLLNPRIDPDLETISLKCLEKEPARRYKSADDLADDLGRWLRSEPITARPVTAPERALKWARRRPAIAALCSAVFAVAVAGLAGVLWQWRASVANAEKARVFAKDAEIESARARAGEQDAIKSTFSPAGDVITTCGNGPVVRFWSTQKTDDLAIRPDGPSLRHPSNAVRVRFSADSTRRAVALGDGTVCLWQTPAPPAARRARLLPASPGEWRTRPAHARRVASTVEFPPGIPLRIDRQ
jgi:Protein kinase domain